MNKQELTDALTMARDVSIDLSGQTRNIDVFSGYGRRNFQTVFVTIADVASLIRWQCIRFDGMVDHEEFQGIAIIGRRKFQIIGP